MDGANPDERPTQHREYSGPGSTLGLAALIVLVVAGLFWFYELRGNSTTVALEEGLGIIPLADELNPTDEAPAARLDRAAPNFKLGTPEGEYLQLSELRGQYVLLNFWASWCGPCRTETPDFQRFFSEHDDPDFTIVGVNQQESAATASAFAANFDVTYPIALDLDGSVSAGYRVSTGLPISFLIGPDGTILDIVIGRVSTDVLAGYAEAYPF